MTAVRRFAELYGGFVADHPYIMLATVIFAVIIAIFGNSLLQTVAMDQKAMLPKDDPTVKSLNYLEDEFGGSQTALIVVELDSKEAFSNEVTDIRDPRVIEYVDVISQKAGKLQYVTSSASAADLIKEDGRIPRSKNTINSLLEGNLMSGRYISSDYSMTLVQLNLLDKYDENRLYSELTSIVEETPAPPGVTAKPSGSVVVGSSIKNQIAPDMAKTGQISFILVLILVMITFSNIRYGLTSLFAIFTGTVWAFGLMGITGMTITSATSAGLSMILGIGIDFGIQVVQRFRIEAKKYGTREGMIETIDAVLIPMSTTTLAALIGFRAMSLGELTILSELASMMSIGIFCCMIAAITVVPVALVLGHGLSARAIGLLSASLGKRNYSKIPGGLITLTFGEEFNQKGGTR